MHFNTLIASQSLASMEPWPEILERQPSKPKEEEKQES